MNEKTAENGQEKLGAWAIVELFGHTRIAGFVSEYVIGGASFVRIDVPATAGLDDHASTAAFTRLYGPGAIYSVTFVDEATAKRAVAAIQPRPISIYIPAAPALSDGRDRWDAADDEDDDEDLDSDY